MAKRRNISIYSDLKTGFFSKLCIFLGIILLVIYFVQLLIPSLGIGDQISGIILSFSIIFLGLGIILFFFQCQFAKLAKIAEEIEKGCESDTMEKK